MYYTTIIAKIRSHKYISWRTLTNHVFINMYNICNIQHVFQLLVYNSRFQNFPITATKNYGVPYMLNC